MDQQISDAKTNVTLESVDGNQVNGFKPASTSSIGGRVETPENRKKRVLNRRLRNVHKHASTLVKTFDQLGYDHGEDDLRVAEALLNDMLTELQCTKAAKKLRGQTRSYQV